MNIILPHFTSPGWFLYCNRQYYVVESIHPLGGGGGRPMWIDASGLNAGACSGTYRYQWPQCMYTDCLWNHYTTPTSLLSHRLMLFTQGSTTWELGMQLFQRRYCSDTSCHHMFGVRKHDMICIHENSTPYSLDKLLWPSEKDLRTIHVTNTDMKVNSVTFIYLINLLMSLLLHPESGNWVPAKQNLAVCSLYRSKSKAINITLPQANKTMYVVQGKQMDAYLIMLVHYLISIIKS